MSIKKYGYFSGTHLRCEGSKGSEGKVDGASPRGLWPPDGGGLCRRVVKGRVLRIDGPFRAQGFLSLTALRAEGCGIALAGDEYKASVTDLLSVSYDMLPTGQGGGARDRKSVV